MDCGITTAAFHPDGVILGTGCQDTMVRVWEVRQQKVRMTLNQRHMAAAGSTRVMLLVSYVHAAYAQ